MEMGIIPCQYMKGKQASDNFTVSLCCEENVCLATCIDLCLLLSMISIKVTCFFLLTINSCYISCSVATWERHHGFGGKETERSGS